MADPTTGEARAGFLKIFRATAPHKHRYDVFRDFVTMAAISLHNTAAHDDAREQEYLALINSYDPPDRNRFTQLLGELVTILEPEPRDALGPLYMALEIASKDQGQFFTPSEVSDAMAQITFADLESRLKTEPFITLSEPACGAGGMVLSAVKRVIQGGHDPALRMWVQCIDIDRLAALMCYVQLSLWNVPAQVIIGDTLRWQHREQWFTPAHYMGGWRARLAAQNRRAKSAGTGAATTAVDTAQVPDLGPIPELDPEPEPSRKTHERHHITWRGQKLVIHWCPDWSLDPAQGQLEVLSENRDPHPLSKTGYLSHFLPPSDVADAGGPVAYTTAWLTETDDGTPVQLSLF